MSKVTAAIVVSVTALIAEAVEAAGAHKTLDDTLVFLHGENGYPCIRTPSLVRTSSGVLLAFAGTRCGRGDGCDPTSKFQQATHQDAVMKRSTDGGVTWGPLSVVHVANCSQHDHGAPGEEPHAATTWCNPVQSYVYPWASKLCAFLTKCRCSLSHEYVHFPNLFTHPHRQTSH